MKKRSDKLYKLMLTCIILMISFSVVSCKGNGDELSEEEISSYDHIFSNLVSTDGNASPEPVVDKDGFYVTDDYIYIKNDQANIKSSPDPDAETITTMNYGQQVYRTGYNDEGWNRITYEEGSAYVQSKYITELTLNTDTEFSYSLAALNIVETQRQFYTYEDLCSDLNDIREAFPDVVELNAVGLTADSRTVFEIVIGNPEAEHSILVTAGMEACEYMTSMFAAKLAEYYAHYSSEGLYEGYSYKQLLENCSIHIVPMLNPDGVSVSQFNLESVNKPEIYENINSWFERDQSNGGTSLSLDNYLLFFHANANGVDLTKNFPYRWEDAESIQYPASSGYKGETEASENETRNIIRLMEKYNPDVVINLRTSGDSISYDFGLNDEIYKKAYGYADLLSNIFVYTRDDSCYGKSYYGTLEGYSACVKNIPALRIKIGSGNAPLSLNEYSSIWNSGRESLAALMVKIINE